jgi:hypothetical protein
MRAASVVRTYIPGTGKAMYVYSSFRSKQKAKRILASRSKKRMGGDGDGLLLID